MSNESTLSFDRMRGMLVRAAEIRDSEQQQIFDSLDEMEWLTLNAMKSAFAPFDQRLRLINGVIKPGYARLMADALAEAPTLA